LLLFVSVRFNFCCIYCCCVI